jgi:hypothetical protein
VGLGCPLSGGACPGETDQHIRPPPVAEALWGIAEAQPADRDQVFAGGFDIAQVHAKDLGNPGGFAPATTDAALLPIVETTDHMPQHRRDDGGAAPPGNAPHHLAGYRHTTLRVRDGVEHAAEVTEIVDTPEICGGGGKRELRPRPGEEPDRFETAEGGPEMLPPYPPNEPMEFGGCIGWDLVRSKLAAPRHHLMGGKPDTQVHELDESAAVGPPHEAKLLDEEQTKSAVGLFCCAFRIDLLYLAV